MTVHDFLIWIWKSRMRLAFQGEILYMPEKYHLCLRNAPIKNFQFAIHLLEDSFLWWQLNFKLFCTYVLLFDCQIKAALFVTMDSCHLVSLIWNLNLWFYFRTPNFEIIKSLFAETKEVTYFEFLVSLSKSEDINSSIGKKFYNFLFFYAHILFVKRNMHVQTILEAF